MAITMRRSLSLLLVWSYCTFVCIAAWAASCSRSPRRVAIIFSSPRLLLSPSSEIQEQDVVEGNVTILDRGPHHVVVAKPPSVVCHYSGWTGCVPEIPMLQRVRNAVGKRINLVHRLDRGASGCLLCTFTDDDAMLNSTQVLTETMAFDTTNKTYVALVRGEGILHGEDFKTKGWFPVTRPIKDERGVLNDATTYFRFVAGQDNGNGTMERPRASLVLARPCTGRWHQIRRHLNGLSHPILGDSTHGSSRENREWRKRGLPGERLCLHLAELNLPPTLACPDGIHATCPLPNDMMEMLQVHLPNVWKEAQPILEQEGIFLQQETKEETLPFRALARY